MRALFLSIWLLGSACGAGSTEPPAREVGTTDGVGGDDQSGTDPARAPVDHRALALGSHFGELVESARGLDDESQAESDAGCILRGAGPYRFLADVAVAIRPLPDAPDDLDARLERTGTARLFTRWGQIHPDGEVALVSFTATPAPSALRGAAIFVTDRGIYVRPAGSGEVHGPLPFTEGAGAARATVAASPMTLVTAEASVSLSALRDLLETLPREASPKVALAVVLAEDVRLPAPAPHTDDGRGLCPDGLPRLRGNVGELETADIVSALGPLRDGATQCMATATGPGAAGTRIGLAMRIGPDGRLAEACMTADSAADPVLRDCLLDAARATTFPAPDPPGSVDVILPMELVPDASLAQLLVCP